MSSEPKDVSKNVTTRYNHFQNVTKMSLHCDTLQDSLKNVSTSLVTLCFFKTCSKVSQKYVYIAYIGAN
jgi:hypothetical protein